MRLYLSSFRIGNKPQEWLDMIGDNKRTAVIVNAKDFKPEEERPPWLKLQMDAVTALGLEPEDLDLREYFSNPAALKDRMKDFGSVWVCGGNAFILKRAYEQSGFDRLITEMVKKDEIVYAGYSAGVCVLAPSLEGIDLCDPPAAVPPGYKSEFDWNGLGITGYAILPHYKSDHPETHMIDQVAELMDKRGIKYRPLRDGQAIVINGQKEYIVG